MKKKTDYLFLISYLLVLAFLLWRCGFGLAEYDECGYLALPYRLAQGDGLFVNDWTITQMSAFLQYPLVKLYLAIAGSTEGILLGFRYIYVIIWSLGALLVYCKVKKYSAWGGYLAALIFQIYAPFSIPALSYNTMGILSLTAALLFASAEGGRTEYFQKFIAGIFLAAAVLCCPYLVLLYAVYAVAVIVALFLRKKGKPIQRPRILEGKTFWWITAGCASLAVVFLSFVLSRATISEVGTAIPYILDEGHGYLSTSLFSKVWMYMRSTGYFNRYVIPEYVLCFVLWIGILAGKNGERKKKYFQAGVLLTILNEMTVIVVYHYINNLFFALNVLVFLAYFVAENKEKIRILFYFIWIPGMIYSFCLHMSSDQGFLAISSASLVAFVGGAPILILVAKEFWDQEGEKSRRVFVKTFAGLIALFGIVLCGELEIRYSNVYWDTPVWTQTVLLEAGPEKGIRVSKKQAARYQELYSAVASLEKKYAVESAVYRVHGLYGMCYLTGDVRNAFLGVWSTNYTEKKTKAYYKMNPDRLPQLIYIAKDGDGSCVEWLYSGGQYEKVYEKDGNVAYLRKE